MRYESIMVADLDAAKVAEAGKRHRGRDVSGKEIQAFLELATAFESAAKKLMGGKTLVKVAAQKAAVLSPEDQAKVKAARAWSRKWSQIGRQVYEASDAGPIMESVKRVHDRKDLVRVALDAATLEEVATHEKSRTVLANARQEWARAEANRHCPERDVCLNERAEGDVLRSMVGKLQSELEVARQALAGQSRVRARYNERNLAALAVASAERRKDTARLYRVIEASRQVIHELRDEVSELGDEVSELRDAAVTLKRDRDHFNALFSHKMNEVERAQRQIDALEAIAEANAQIEHEHRCFAVAEAQDAVMESATYKCGRLVLSPVTVPWWVVKKVLSVH